MSAGPCCVQLYCVASSLSLHCLPVTCVLLDAYSMLQLSESRMPCVSCSLRFIMKTVMPVCGRLVVWLMGFTWVRTYGHQVSFKEAQVTVLSPHSSIFDSFFTGAYVDGCYMTLKSNLKMPVVGGKGLCRLLFAQEVLAHQGMFIGRTFLDWNFSYQVWPGQNRA